MLDDDIKKDDDVKTDDDSMTDGIPTDTFNAIRDAMQPKDTDDSTDDDVKDDDVVDDKVEDDQTDDDTNDNDGDDDVTDNDSVDDGDTDTDDGIDVLGWDAETVQKLNDINPNIVEDVKALLEQGTDDDDSSEDDTVADHTTTKKVEIKGDVTEEQLAALEKENPAMAAIVKSLNAKVGTLSTALNSQAEDEEARAKEAEDKEHYRNFCTLNKSLDKLVKDFPVLGLYDKLPKNEDGVPDERNRSVKHRAEIWGKANALYKTGMFGSFEESLENAVVLYQGKHGENRAMRKVVKDLNDRKKQFTNRPTKNKTKKKEPKPGTDEHKKSIVRNALKESGATA